MNLVGFLKKPRLVANPQADAAGAWIKVAVELAGEVAGAVVPVRGNIPFAVAEAVARGSRGSRGDRTRQQSIPPPMSAAALGITFVLGSGRTWRPSPPASAAPTSTHSIGSPVATGPCPRTPVSGERAAARLDSPELGADRGSHASYLEAARGEAHGVDAAMSAETETSTRCIRRARRAKTAARELMPWPGRNTRPSREPVADPYTRTELEPTVEAQSAPEPAPAPDVDPALTADAPTPSRRLIPSRAGASATEVDASSA